MLGEIGLRPCVCVCVISVLHRIDSGWFVIAEAVRDVYVDLFAFDSCVMHGAGRDVRWASCQNCEPVGLSNVHTFDSAPLSPLRTPHKKTACTRIGLHAMPFGKCRAMNVAYCILSGHSGL